MIYKGSKAVGANGSTAIKTLIESGVIPPECRRFELLAEAGGLILLRFEVNATEDQMEIIAKALSDNRDELIREVVPVASVRKVTFNRSKVFHVDKTSIESEAEEFALVDLPGKA